MFKLFSFIWRLVKLAVFISIIGFVLMFFGNNNQSVILSLNPFPYQMEIKLFLLIIFFFFFGIFCSFIFSTKMLIGSKIDDIRNKWKIKKLEKVIKKGSKDKIGVDSDL